ncbi:MAG TPA: dephospho-CoA kinase [Sporichthyaceae bacterium]|jgi:dephospho-CoA kinase
MHRVQVGLTGGIGSGKTTVTDELARLGAVIVDSDVLAREVVAAGSEGLAAVVAAFGPQVLGPDGEMDRAKVAAIVFNDPAARQTLNGIVHPAVRVRAAELVRAAGPDAIVIQAVPLLVEAGLANAYDLVVVVDVDPEVALDRLVNGRGMEPADARARIAAQADRATRLAAADVVLDNSGDREAMRTRVQELWAELKKRQNEVR